MSALMKSAATLCASPIYISENYTTTGPADAGTALDLIDYEGVGAVVLRLKNLAGTTPTCAGTVVASATSSGSYTALSPAVSFTTSTGATTNATYVTQIQPFEVSAAYRYLKINVTLTGTNNPGYAIDATFVGWKKSS